MRVLTVQVLCASAAFQFTLRVSFLFTLQGGALRGGVLAERRRDICACRLGKARQECRERGAQDRGDQQVRSYSLVVHY